MGNGQVGGNSSVEWIFSHIDANIVATTPPTPTSNGTARAIDPIDFPQIGTSPGLTPGHFTVTLT